MAIRITMNLSLDNEAGKLVEEIIAPYLGKEMSDEACAEEREVVANYLKRLGSKPLTDIRRCIVDIEDVW